MGKETKKRGQKYSRNKRNAMTWDERFPSSHERKFSDSNNKYKVDLQHLSSVKVQITLYLMFCSYSIVLQRMGNLAEIQTKSQEVGIFQGT